MPIFRATGVIESADVKSGLARATQKPYSIPTRSIRVNEFVVTEVTLADADKENYMPGEVVDVIVDVSANGGYVSGRVVGPWPAESTASHLKSA